MDGLEGHQCGPKRFGYQSYGVMGEILGSGSDGWVGVGLGGHWCGPKRFGMKSMGFQVGFWGHTVMVGLEGHQSGPK